MLKNMVQQIAPHETIKLHELLTFKNLCLTKSVTMSQLVSDEELRSILQNDTCASRQHTQQLSGLMNHSYIATYETISNYMMKKGYYNAYNLQEQYKVDMQITETALNLS